MAAVKSYEYNTLILWNGYNSASKFEKTEGDHLKTLDAMGNDGWELVSVVPYGEECHQEVSNSSSPYDDISKELLKTTTIKCFFKREKA